MYPLCGNNCFGLRERCLGLRDDKDLTGLDAGAAEVVLLRDPANDLCRADTLGRVALGDIPQGIARMDGDAGERYVAECVVEALLSSDV